MRNTILAAWVVALAGAAATPPVDAVAPAASAASGVDPAVAAQRAEKRAVDAAKLDEAVRLIGTRQPQAAIDRILDPLIAAEDAANAARTETLYCANSPNEALYYMLQAARDKKSAIALEGTLCNALYMRAFAEVNLGRADAAEADLTRAVTLAPSNAHYLSEMGQLQSRKRDWAASLAWFQRAEAASEFSMPNQVKAERGRALRGIGYVDVELGKLDEAEASYRRCLEIDPHDQKAQAELGYVQGLKAGQAAPAK